MERFLGILMLDTVFPRIPGDIGNPETYPFPVRKLVVQNANPQRVVHEADPTLLEPFLQAAEQLEKEGAAAITTSCGFLAMFQKELAARVHVPVFASSLLQVPYIQTMLPAGKKVGIMTAKGGGLGPRHFAGVGIWKDADPENPENERPIIYGMEGTHFYDVFPMNGPVLDREKAEREMVEKALQMKAEHPEVGAIVFECTNMPPYSAAVAEATGLPVFDINTLAEYIMRGVLQKKYSDGPAVK